LKDLPRFEGPIPSGSMAMVGYTVGSYAAKATPKDVSISMNLLWIAIFNSAVMCVFYFSLAKDGI
jgi:hypothetical protein